MIRNGAKVGTDHVQHCIWNLAQATKEVHSICHLAQNWLGEKKGHLYMKTFGDDKCSNFWTRSILGMLNHSSSTRDSFPLFIITTSIHFIITLPFLSHSITLSNMNMKIHKYLLLYNWGREGGTGALCTGNEHMLITFESPWRSHKRNSPQIEN
jgi:hypothetical protein